MLAVELRMETVRWGGSGLQEEDDDEEEEREISPDSAEETIERREEIRDGPSFCEEKVGNDELAISIITCSGGGGRGAGDGHLFMSILQAFSLNIKNLSQILSSKF